MASKARKTKPATRAGKALHGMHEKGEFNPGGHKGKLHRELGVPEGKKIPAKKLEKAEHSKNPEVRRDAIRAETMKHWKHGSKKKRK